MWLPAGSHVVVLQAKLTFTCITLQCPMLCICERASLNASTLRSEPGLRMQEFVATLNKNGQRWVPILDPPIHIKPGYAPYDSGIAQDVFVKDITGNPYVGQVWEALLLKAIKMVLTLLLALQVEQSERSCRGIQKRPWSLLDISRF